MQIRLYKIVILIIIVELLLVLCGIITEDRTANGESTRMSQPKKWFQVYPQGTKAGDEEQKFFKAIARHPKYDWRSIASIHAETGLSKKRVEEIIAKYFNLGMVFQNPKNEDQWGYWELHKKLLPKTTVGIAAKDTKKRVDKATDKTGVGAGAAPKKKVAKKVVDDDAP
jgi:hypothetical protein